MDAAAWIAQANEIMDNNEGFLVEFNNTSSREPFYGNMRDEARRIVAQNNHLRAGISLLKQCPQPA